MNRKQVISILLVAPYSGLPYWEAVQNRPFLNEKAFMLPVHIATLAALTPEDVEVHLWDEAVHGPLCEATELPRFDLLAVTGYSTHLARAKEIARHFRERGIILAVGGAGVSTNPENYREDFDTLFIGEAELTWPQFISDLKTGIYRSEYRQITKPDLTGSPAPRWDGIADQIDRYLVGGVQTTRGCPFDCEFCDVLYLFGRGPRHKKVPRILDEVAALQRLGMQRIFFCDDNFAGDPQFTKMLLRELIPLNSSFPKAITFSTQLSIDIASDEEMLDLLARANFGSVLIGIETPNRESLGETNKIQNLKTDLVEACGKIQSYGLPILASMIVGFDHDTPEIFDRQFDFIQEANIPNASICILGARTGTRLWNRLRKEGRLLRAAREGHYAPIIPKGMNRETLLSGYITLLERVNDWHNFAARVKAMISNVDKRFEFAGGRLDLKQVRQALAMFRLVNRDVVHHVPGILWHTMRKAPWMMGEAFSLIATQYLQAAYLPLIRETLAREIELERTSDLEQRIDRQEVGVPDTFRSVYDGMFEPVYEQVHSDLSDKTRADEALVEIFTDFLLRVGPTFGGSSACDETAEHHLEFLSQLADRSVNRINAAGRAGPVPRGLAVSTGGEGAERRLAAEVLKAVEQQLRLGPDHRACGRDYGSSERSLKG